MRIYFLILILFSTLFAQEKYELIDDFLLSKDKKEFVSILDNDIEVPTGKYFLKIVLNKAMLKNNNFYLKAVYGYKGLKAVSIPAKIEDNMAFIPLNKNTPKEIFLTCDAEFSNTSFDLSIYTQKEFEGLPQNENLFFGLAYGIIFSAFLYNLVLFIFNKEKTFLYYALFEFFLLFLLLLQVMTPDIIKPLYKHFNVLDVIGNVVLIFAILFNICFLDLKKYFPKFEMFLKFLIVIHVFDTALMIFLDHGVLYDYLPASSVLFMLLISSFLVYKQGYKIAIFYILGWAVIFFSVLFVEMESLNYPDIYALHLGLPLESLILSLILGYKFKKLQDDKTMHAQMLIHQNKLASMGEMINNIAHQYRQPLTHIAYIFMNIKSAYEHDELDKKYLDKKLEQGNRQLSFLSKTIDNFRDFYKPDKQKEKFSILEATNSAIDILKPVFKEKSIELICDIDETSEIKGYKNEYSQVVLNLLTNAKDALIEEKTKNPKIKVVLKKEKKVTQLFITDNARGVKKENEKRVFEPYFSTKTKSSGIGLYMSSMIIHEHFEGKLYLKNSSLGATFVVEV